MKRRSFLVMPALAAAAGLAACSTPAQTASAPSAPAQDTAAAKPVFIDFYAPW